MTVDEIVIVSTQLTTSLNIYAFELLAASSGWLYIRVSKCVTLSNLNCNSYSTIQNRLADGAKSGIYGIGHDYLFYTYVKSGYNIIEVDCINVTAKSFISVLQSGSAKIATRPETSIRDYYWDESQSIWLAPGSGPTRWSHYLRVITSPFNVSLNTSIMKSLSYVAPGVYNLTATLNDTGQIAEYNFTVELGMKSFCFC